MKRSKNHYELQHLIRLVEFKAQLNWDSFKFSIYKQLLNTIKDGRIFSANITKADGSARTITGRIGVKKNLTGAGLKYDPGKVQNIIVFDMHKNAYRTIKLDRLNWVKIDGQKIQINKENNYNNFLRSIENAD